MGFPALGMPLSRRVPSNNPSHILPSPGYPSGAEPVAPVPSPHPSHAPGGPGSLWPDPAGAEAVAGQEHFPGGGGHGHSPRPGRPQRPHPSSASSPPEPPRCPGRAAPLAARRLRGTAPLHTRENAGQRSPGFPFPCPNPAGTPQYFGRGKRPHSPFLLPLAAAGAAGASRLAAHPPLHPGQSVTYTPSCASLPSGSFSREAFLTGTCRLQQGVCTPGLRSQ